MILAASRAVLMALRDGYWKTRATGLATGSLADDFVSGLLACVLASIVLATTWHASRSALLKGLALLLALAGGYLFAAGRVPSLPFHAPGFEGSRALMAHAAAAIGAALFATALFVSPTRLAVARRGLAVASVLAILAALVVPFVIGNKPGAWPERPNVILISLDTLRSDHVSCYGYERETTPELDRFAADSTRFTRAYAPHPWTLTSHMTMFTGLYPSNHSVDDDKRLPSSVPTIAQLFKDEGYVTAALVDPVVWLDERFGFSRGFDTYRRVHGAADVRNHVLESLLDDIEPHPFFLFLHYFDPHSDKSQIPYESKPEDFDEFCAWYQGDFTGCVEGYGCASELLLALNRNDIPLTDDDRRYIVDLYDSGIRTMDRALGELFDGLGRRGLFENSVIVVTADHGEEFWEHGRLLHGSHYEECVSVPLLVRVPNGTAGVADELLGHVDLAPTLLELAGLSHDEVGGRSFAPVVTGTGEYTPREHIFFDSGEGNLGVFDGRYKLIEDRGTIYLFDLAEDPEETTNLLARDAEPAIASTLRGVLAVERERIQSIVDARVKENLDVDLSRDDREELGNFGYAGND